MTLAIFFLEISTFYSTLTTHLLHNQSIFMKYVSGTIVGARTKMIKKTWLLPFRDIQTSK